MELSYYRMYIELLMGNDSIVDAIVDSMIILSCLAKTLDIFYACLACVLVFILSPDLAFALFRVRGWRGLWLLRFFALLESVISSLGLGSRLFRLNPIPAENHL